MIQEVILAGAMLTSPADGVPADTSKASAVDSTKIEVVEQAPRSPFKVVPSVEWSPRAPIYRADAAVAFPNLGQYTSEVPVLGAVLNEGTKAVVLYRERNPLENKPWGKWNGFATVQRQVYGPLHATVQAAKTLDSKVHARVGFSLLGNAQTETERLSVANINTVSLDGDVLAGIEAHYEGALRKPNGEILHNLGEQVRGYFDARMIKQLNKAKGLGVQEFGAGIKSGKLGIGATYAQVGPTKHFMPSITYR